jgi:hypothetical protein
VPSFAADPPSGALVRHYDGSGCNVTGRFDSAGAVLVDYGGAIGLRHNPVTTAHYAIGCYYEYRRTGSAAARRIYLNQIRYLRSHYETPSPGLAAYRYDFPWSYGLAPGWHSGLAQGQVISALVRYHYDTGDSTVLPLIRALERFMVLPESAGGLAVTSPEGGLWIEEFPSSPPSYVLNGFISATFGLYEFTRLFPDDEAARASLYEAIASIKRSVAAYDTGRWATLDRHSSPYPGANDDYMIGYVFQARTLAEISGDPFFAHLSLRWHSFLSDVNVHARGNTADLGDGSFLPRRELSVTLPRDILAHNIASATSTPTLPGYGVDKLFDHDSNTYFAPAEEGQTFLCFTLVHPTEANTLALGLYNPTLFPEELAILVRTDRAAPFRPLEYQRAADRRHLVYYFDPILIADLCLRALRTKGQNRMVLGELALGTTPPARDGAPAYGSFLTVPYEMTRPTFSVVAESPDAEPGNMVAMYRSADTLDALEEGPWAFDFIDPRQPNERPVRNRFYQFKILTQGAAAASPWRNLNIAGGNRVLGRIGTGGESSMPTAFWAAVTGGFIGIVVVIVGTLVLRIRARATTAPTRSCR